MSYFHYDSNESFESFVSKCLNVLSKEGKYNFKFNPSKLKDIVNPEFDNILYATNPSLDKFEIYFEKVRNGEGDYYYFKVNKLPKIVKTRFGCELETCFVLDCKDSDLASDPVLYSGDYEESWRDKVISHLRKNIIPSLTEAFKKRFTYAYVKGYHARKGIYLDLSNGNIVSKSMKSDEYKTLRFEPDGSIHCSDPSTMVACEIISPILSSISEIKLLYEGLVSESCNQSNQTTGFHVNVSGYDENDEMIELTRGMQTELLYGWIPYERKNYKALRGDGSTYAMKLEDVINDISQLTKTNYIIKNRDGSDITNYEYFAPYGLNIWKVYKIINIVKYYSMTHWKNNNVVEFRIFPSKNDINLLLGYTKDAIDVFSSSISSYINNPEKTLLNLQKTYLLYKYSDIQIPIPVIEGDYQEINVLMEIINCNINLSFKKVKKYLIFDDIISYPSMHIWEDNLYNVMEYKLPSGEPIYYSYETSYNSETDISTLKNPQLISQDYYDFLLTKNAFKRR